MNTMSIVQLFAAALWALVFALCARGVTSSLSHNRRRLILLLDSALLYVLGWIAWGLLVYGQALP